MTSEIKDNYTLNKEFDEVPSSDNLAFVNLQERNSHSVESININKDELHYNAKLRLVPEYGMSLFASGQDTQAVKVLSKAISMFENTPNQNKSDLKNISYFEHLL